MARGIPAKGFLKASICKTCGFKSKSKSIFMTHLRFNHPELFKNSPRKSLIKVKLAEPVIDSNSNETKELSARELLNKLKHQRNFIVDVVNLIEGMLNRQ